MRPERIKQLRSSIRLVPELVRASMVTQAFELEKLITATIDLSEGMEAALRSMPQAYREAITKLYRELLYKSYDAGYTNASLKQGLFARGTDILLFVRDKMPLPYSLEMTLLKTFTEDTATFLKTVESKEAIYEQFKRDIEHIYCDGAMEYLKELPAPEAKEAEMAEKAEQPAAEAAVTAKDIKEFSAYLKKCTDSQVEGVYEKEKKAGREEYVELALLEMEERGLEAAASVTAKSDSEKPKAQVTPEEVKRHLEEYAKLAGSPEGANVLRTYLGLSAKAEFEEDAKDNEKPHSGVSKEEIIKKFEEYAAKAGTPEGAKVLRYYLGLPVQANVAKTVGSYEIPALRTKVLSLIKGHEFSKAEYQEVIVDSVTAKCGPDLAKSLGISELLPADYTFAEAKLAADELAAELTNNLDLPGTFVFADLDDSLILAFSFKATDFEQPVIAAKKKAKSELPAGPMGALDENDKKELESLHSLDRGSLKMMVLKDLKKVAPKVVDLISEWLTKTRNSELKMGELSQLFSMPIVDVVEKAYNRDGAEYFKHLAKKA